MRVSHASQNICIANMQLHPPTCNRLHCFVILCELTVTDIAGTCIYIDVFTTPANDRNGASLRDVFGCSKLVHYNLKLRHLTIHVFSYSVLRIL